MIRGIVEAKSPNEAASYLRTHQFVPVAISDVPETSITHLLRLKNKFSSRDLVFFTRQLSSMISAGLTLMQALNILKSQVQNSYVSEVIVGVTSQIEDGKPFYLALSKYPQVFPQIYVSLVRASEESGLLDKVLLRLADNLEKQEKLKSTIKGALLYPIIVVILMIVVVTVMMIFVIPQLSALYENLNIPLPLPTQIIVGMSNLFVTAWPLMLGIGVGVVYFFRRWHKSDAGRQMTDKLVLKLPIFGKIISQSIMTEFSRTFGLMVGTGTLVVEALAKTSDIVGNSQYRNAIISVSRRVEKGITIGNAMAASPIFPTILVEMVRIGEQTGKLDESLTRVSEYFEREVEEMVKNLTTAMEPLIIIMLAVGVGFLIISIITPIYNLISSIS